MNNILILTKRNLKLYLRDKAAVFFSFLSTIIVVALYFLFIAKLYTSGMDSQVVGESTLALTTKEKNFIIYLQMIAGVLVLNSISLATGAFSTIAKDFENKRIDSLMLAPIKPFEIIIAYFSTGFISSFAINIMTLILSCIIIGIFTGLWITASAFFMVVVILLIASLISCSIMLFITSIVKSSTAIGVANGVMGTFFGFLCGIYIPYSNLGKGATAVGSFLPFSHITIWLKQVVLNDAFTQVSIDPKFKEILFAEHFSAKSIGFCNLPAPLWLMLLISGIFGIACLIASNFILGKRIRR